MTNRIKSLKWLVGVIINAVLIIILYNVLNPLINVNLGETLIIASLIQMVFVVPTYVREVNIMPQGAPTQLKGMTENDYNGNVDYMGIKPFPIDQKVDKDLKGIKWYIFRRSVMQQLVYFIFMLGSGIYLVMQT